MRKCLPSLPTTRVTRFVISCAAVVIFATLGALPGCSGSIGSYQSLANRGILALSEDNPYLGTNLFIAQEASKSKVFFNFLHGRGAPTAIEIHDKPFEPLRMHLFYPQERAYYTAELSSRESSGQWIVRGPFQVSRLDFKELAPLQAALKTEPLFVIQGRPYRFGSAGFTDKPRVLTPLLPGPTATPTATPRPKRRAPAKPTAVSVPAGTPTPAVDPNRPLNSDQRALLIAQGFAERAPNGDLIHIVKSDGEDLKAITEWYTGDGANEEAVRTANGLAAGTAPSKGAKLTIPAKLVKNPKAMGAVSAAAH